MPLPTNDTFVTYPDGAIVSIGTVLHVKSLTAGRSAVLLDITAFHPVEMAWPDQPADRGTMTTTAGTQPILGCVTGGIRDGELHLGTDMPVRMGTDGWVFVVAHLIEGPPPAVGESVQIDVEDDLRAALSAGHTACHLAALALDAALAAAWTKPVVKDALGNPAFDSLAIQHSRIDAHRSTDTYRIGKSLRKKGFSPTSLDDPASVAERVNAQLSQWIQAGGAVRIDREAAALSARRTWVCELPTGRINIPCGGTHIQDLAELSAINASLTIAEIDGGHLLIMETVAAPN
ncbi:metal-dependent hydrolase [Paenarthrobacter histidinolovorans]|uniref:metal-dependent hydrolase n=1 Tax=Paenarthrobacter histidinolovorans TaxID=43664 RepID=UPI0016645C35|nr:metal-dependent hydrolase [Paenarthrobacter histidinolovorans]GGJ40596.1 hypothetical protein GCM10010052_42110 [Paenarthrobacter histidinolovorans]